MKPTVCFKFYTLLISVTNNRVGSLLDEEKYARILNRLYEKKPFHVVVNGELKDREKSQKLWKRLKMPARLIVTEHLSEFLGLLASVDGVFVGDGGIMHLAAALGKNQVVLFGGTEVWEWGPLSEKTVCLQHEHNVNCIPEDQILKALNELW